MDRATATTGGSPYELTATLPGEDDIAVFVARHRRLGSEHILKVFIGDNPTRRERFEREGRAQARLQHPNAIRVTDVVEHEGCPALVLEVVDGLELNDWVERVQPTIKERLRVFRDIVRATKQAHGLGILHRNLAPHNILITTVDGRAIPKITGFQAVKFVSEARRTHMGMQLGSLGYTSPEQLSDAGAVDERTDVFSLGCILYTLMCGCPPFDTRDILDLVHKVRTGDVVLPRQHNSALSPPLEALILEMLDPNVARRTPSCAAALSLLDLDAPNRPWRRPTPAPQLAEQPHAAHQTVAFALIASAAGMAVVVGLITAASLVSTLL